MRRSLARASWRLLLVACLCPMQARPFQGEASAAAPPEGVSDRASDPDDTPAVAAEIAATTEYLVFAAQHEQGTVDPLTGHLHLVLEDLSAAGGPTEVRLVRSLIVPGYLPPSTQNRLGPCWRWNWECQLIEADRDILIADGAVLKRFRPLDGAPAGTFQSADGESLVLQKDQSALTRIDGATDVFDENGRLRSRSTRSTSVSLTYDSDERLAKIETSDHEFLEFQYVGNDVIRVQNAARDSVTYRLQGHQLVRVEPPSGIATDYTYGDSDRLKRIVHPQFGTLQLEYDAQGRLTARRWQDGSLEQLDYETDQVVRHVGRDGAVTVTQHDPEGGTVRVTDPTGRQVRLQFDRRGQLVQIANAQGEGHALSYDQRGRLSQVTGPDQQAIRLGYEANASVPARVTSAHGTQYALEYDDQDRLVRARTGGLGETTFEYGPSGRVTAIRSSYAPGFSLSYDSQGRVHEITDAAGHRSVIEYDDRGNPVRETDGLGQVTTKSYDAGGRLTSVTDPAGTTIRYEYTPSGLLAARTAEAGAATRFQYLGRDIVVTDPAGAQTTYRYSSTGLLSEVVSPLGHRFRYEYDPSGNLTCETNPAGGTTLFEYDAGGRATRIVEPTGAVTQMRYDAAGQLLSVSDEQGERERFEYNDQGVLCTSQRRDGTRIEWEPSPIGPRVHSVSGPGPQATPWIYSYDAHGNLLRIQHDRSILLLCEYDALDRRVRQVNDRGLEIRFEYDPWAG